MLVWINIFLEEYSQTTFKIGAHAQINPAFVIIFGSYKNILSAAKTKTFQMVIEKVTDTY